MKVRVNYTTEVSDDYRMALSHRHGSCGRLASRQDVKEHLEQNGSSMDSDLMWELENCDEGCNPNRQAQ